MQNKFVLLVIALTTLFSPHVQFGQAPNLGTVASFGLFTAAGAINNGGPTNIIGDIGTNVGAFNGFPPGIVTGQIHVADAVSAQAATDVAIAYGYLSALNCGQVLGTTLGSGQILTPNIYCLGAAGTLNGNLILDAQGNSNALFIFQVNGAFATTTLSSVSIINGGAVCNVYWQINGEFDLGTNSSFLGTVIASGAIGLAINASLNGRGLSTAGAISTSSNLVSVLPCVNLPPAINCAAPVSVSCASQVPAPSTTSVSATATCPGPVTIVFLGDAITNQTCTNRYTITRTYRVTDACGLTATCAQTITVNDQTPPGITCPGPVTVSCAGLVPAPGTTAVTASDNCGGAALLTFAGDITSAQTCANRFTLTRTYRATDLCGNSATCAQIITVNDITAPAPVCPAAVLVSCASQVPAAAPASIVTTDNCGSPATVVSLGDVISNQLCANRFTLTRTYRATDLCGNSATCAQIITVNDITAPAPVCPAAVLVSCASQVPAAAPGSIVTTDNCGSPATVVSLGDVISNQLCTNRFTLTRTYQATDQCGNSATCAQIITVNNITASPLVCPVNVSVACAGQVPVAAPGAIATIDNCGGLVTVVSLGDAISNQLCANRFTLTRTYRATDACGNAATCAQIITVFDNTLPTFPNPPANATIECLSTPPPVVSPAANDNCTGGATVVFSGQIQTPGICPVLYTLTRTWVATDACGNSASVSQVITVLDTQAPQFTAPPLNVVLECNQATNANAFQLWLNNHGGASASDCSTVTWTFMDSPFITYPTNCANTFQRFMRFIATDACGNSAFRDASFIVQDLTPPAFTALPQNLNVTCTDGYNGDVELANWLEHFGNAVMSDNCGSVSTQIALVSEKPGCGNTYTRIYQFRATDQCGNTNFVTATFALIDTTPPVFETTYPVIDHGRLTCALDIPAPKPGDMIARDNCGTAIVTLQSTFSVGSGCYTAPMTKTYTYAATDGCGNVSTMYETFQVVDSMPPVYRGPDTIYLACINDLPHCGEISGLLKEDMFDNCSKAVCIGYGQVQNDQNTVVYSAKAKDVCENWTERFQVTFIANGDCKPIYTAPQSVWSDPAATINGMSIAEAVEKIMGIHAVIPAGKLGYLVTVGSPDCLFRMLPGAGNTAQFGPGTYDFGTVIDCQQPSKLLNTNGTLQNELAANVLAMQLNIWYNQALNNRYLGVQELANLPACLIDPRILAQMTDCVITVQGLLDLSNEYLAGAVGYTTGFGDLLNSALANLNAYWQHGQVNDPCSVDLRAGVTPPAALTQLSLAPNPALDIATLHFEATADTEVRIRFIGHAGLQSEHSIRAVKGPNTWQFSTETFPAGLYTVVLQHATGVQTIRLVKVRN